MLNENHASGQKLKEITGIAATCWYPLDLNFDDDEIIENVTEENKSIDDDSFGSHQNLDASFIYDDGELFMDFDCEN